MSQQSNRWTHHVATWITIVVVVVGAAILFLAAGDEPYHVDELRQVRAYGGSIAEIIDASYAQQQPPLDSLVNSAVQGVIGVGDVRQRAVSVVAGIASLIVLGLLLHRNGFAGGSPVAVAMLAVSPALVAVTGYARPYALPLFLMLVFLYASDIWLRRGDRWSAVLLTLVALVLPLSRTSEPPLFLASVVVVLAVVWWVNRPAPLPGSPLVPIAAACVALVGVAVPVYLRLTEELAAYSDTAGATTLDQMRRLFDEVPAVFAKAIPAWPLVLAVAIGAVAVPAARKLLARAWWFWVLVLVPLGFILVFFLRTPLDQPYFSRYAFMWIPAVAVMFGAFGKAAIDLMRGGQRVAGIAAATLIAVVLAATTASVVDDLATTDLADWRAAANAVIDDTPEGTVILFDAVRPWGLWRTHFAARPRYITSERQVPSTMEILVGSQQVSDDQPVAVMLLSATAEVPGWTAIPVDDWFTLYVADEPPIGRIGMGDAAIAFADALGPAKGAALALTAFTLLDGAGRAAEADRAITHFLDGADPDLIEAVADYASDAGIPIPDLSNLAASS